MEQSSVTRRAGASTVDILVEVDSLPGGKGKRRDLARLIEKDDICKIQIRRSHPEPLGQQDIIDIFHFKTHQRSAIGITEDGVPTSEDSIGLYGVAALFKVQISVQTVDDDQIRASQCVQRGDRFMKPHAMGLTLGSVGDAPLHILEGACHRCLAVAFENGKADEEIGLHDRFADFKGDSMNRFGNVGIILHINQANIICIADRIVSVDLECPFGGVSDPGAFND